MGVQPHWNSIEWVLPKQRDSLTRKKGVVVVVVSHIYSRYSVHIIYCPSWTNNDYSKTIGMAWNCPKPLGEYGHPIYEGEAIWVTT